MSFDNRSISPDIDPSKTPSSKTSILPPSVAGSSQAAPPPPSFHRSQQQHPNSAFPPPTPSGSARASPYGIEGNITSSAFYGNTHTVAGDQIQDRRFTGGETLDEPVLTTLMRDVKAVGRRVKQVLHPKADANIDIETGQVIRDWDLWGPLVFCLFLSLALSISAPAKQTSTVFSGVFAFVWIAESLVTLNIKLLGGSMYAYKY